METWSDNQIHSDFKVKFFLDTNILSYLVDKTYSGLTQAIKFLIECDFVELKSSQYVIFEFVGIRKREHFMRCILKKSTGKCGKVNLSSLLKYRDGFSHDGLDYFSESKSIKGKVLRELEKITNEFSVDYKTHEIHTLLWKPIFDIILSSKISREDSVVLISSIFPSQLIKEEGMILLTNDTQFEGANSEKNFQRKINSTFRVNNIYRPEIIHIEKFTCNGKTVNLANKAEDSRAVLLMFNKVQNHQIKKNRKFYLGKTIPVPQRAPQNAICFELPANAVLYENTHLVIIGKDLDFYYTTKSPISDYRNQMNPLVYPYRDNSSQRLSFLFREIDNEGIQIVHPLPMMQKIRQSGNLIFIHPDTF